MDRDDARVNDKASLAAIFALLDEPSTQYPQVWRYDYDGDAAGVLILAGPQAGAICSVIEHMNRVTLDNIQHESEACAFFGTQRDRLFTRDRGMERRLDPARAAREAEANRARRLSGPALVTRND